MTRLGAYLNDPAVKPRTPSCRLKAWAHDNTFTGLLILGCSAVGWAVTVLSCH